MLLPLKQSQEAEARRIGEIRIRCYCVNGDLSWPNKATGRLTKMVYVGPTTDQQTMWSGIANPDTARTKTTKCTARHSMKWKMSSNLKT